MEKLSLQKICNCLVAVFFKGHEGYFGLNLIDWKDSRAMSFESLIFDFKQ
jgi:hypothetical protein